MPSISLRRALTLATALCTALPALSQPHSNYLAGNTVLIIRHAEKPTDGIALTPQGQQRAVAYATYFEPFHDGGLSLHVDALYAGADSKNSIRPRLTLEPLHHATHLPLNTQFATDDPSALVQHLRQTRHCKYPLIAWRHHKIPALLRAFGASPEKFLPNGTWPNDVYDWVIVLSFDPAGNLIAQRRIQEHLQLPQTASTPPN